MAIETVQEPRELAWYNEKLDRPFDEARRLLEEYSGIPPEEVNPHVLAVRAKAWSICPYPCIGQFKFLTLTLQGHPLYSKILSRLRSGETFLDFACCFAQDLRKLVADGAPSENMYGIDIEKPLMDLGYDLFKDRNMLKSTFLPGDIFDDKMDWSALQSKIDIIHASAFFHLFNWEQQVQACRALVGFGRPQQHTIIVGRQVGSVTPGEFPSFQPGTTGFRHDPSTLQKLWDEVGKLTGTRWVVDATMDTVGFLGKADKARHESQKPNWVEPNMRRLLFTITRQ